jgi:CRP/FNR family cyclic AMP-dependent transcriptional regulator
VSTSLANLPEWFRDIPQGILARKTVVIKAGQTIFSQGDDCNRVYYVDNGLVKLSTLSSQGKSAVISILGPGDLVGVSCLTGEKTYQTTAVALVRSTAVRMRSAVLMRLLHERPPAAGQFIDYLLTRYVRIERELINYLINSSEKRLARALLLLDRYTKDVDSSILETITQDTLADIVGTTRPRVNFFLNRFRKRGHIDYGDHGLKINPSLQKVLQ